MAIVRYLHPSTAAVVVYSPPAAAVAAMVYSPSAVAAAVVVYSPPAAAAADTHECSADMDG